MPGNRRGPAVAILAAAFFLQSLFSSLVKSPTADEPYHIAAALSYVTTGRIVVNQQHPPLLKEISGLFLRAAGARWPSTPGAEALMLDVQELGTPVGSAIITGQGTDKIMFWARLPFILLSTLFVFALYALGCRLVESGAALGAVFLYVLDPNILAHSYLVTTDVGLAFFVTVFLLALWAWLQRPGLLRLIAGGLALGAVLGSKFSGIALLPVTAILLFAAAKWPVVPDPPPTGPVFKRRLLRYGIALGVMCAIAFGFLQYIYLLPGNLLQYLDGLHLVNADHNQDFQSMMAGRFAHRFYSYFLVSYLLKEPIAGIVATALGLVAVIRARTVPLLARGFILAPAAVLFGGYTLYADDIGVRYLIPLLPLTFILGGAGLASLFESKRKWGRACGLVLCVWLVVAAAGIYPDHLSYFNEAACLPGSPSKIGLDGGSRCGPEWLDQSNVDWGQGLKQLRTWLDRNAPGKPVRYGNFVALSFPPEAYGIATHPSDYADVLSGTKPGLYAVSAQIVARARDVPGGGWWLRQRVPVAVVGHAIYIYNVTGEPATSPDYSAEAELQLSQAAYRAGDYPGCIAAARRALNLRPGYAEAYNNIAAAYGSMKRWDEAVDAAREAVRLKPDFQMAKNNLAWLQGEKVRARP